MCFGQGIHRVNCITRNKVDGLEALVGGLHGRGPGTVHISKVLALVEVKILIHEQKNLQAWLAH
jgi:hypothetical protein